MKITAMSGEGKLVENGGVAVKNYKTIITTLLPFPLKS